MRGPGGVLPLADFGTVSFIGATVNGSAIGTFPAAERLDMVSGATTKAATSSLGNNQNFSVAWRHS